MNWGKLMFGFEGRIRRTHLWIGMAIAVAARVAVVVLALVVAALVFSSPEAMKITALMVVGLTFVVVFLATTWVEFALSAKRCHDRNKSGWWSLLVLIPFVGLVWGFIDLGLLEGTPGPNRFGPSPKGVDTQTPEIFA